MKENYTLLQKLFKNNFKSNGEILYSDSSNYFDEINESIFFDDVHVSDYGYKVFCKKIFKDLKEWLPSIK